MYVITFYSFKGGVGRSMALANVGVELARRGRRVLLVDFDLEAPGLDTFPLLRPKASTKGIVDFVTEYLVTGISPDVLNFVYEPQLPPSVPGSVIVMPTGLQDDDYGSRLNGIDWQRLYSERDGFLLFEDLKEQWKKFLQPEYVLIDSRTGHTDVSGICTRQLPDAAVLLFFPNDQNERGMQTVVEDIQKEKTRTGKDIALYFVASNVPDLDDEDRILFQRIRHFRKTLKCDEPETIHHYDSMALLEQKIFTLERPRSKLSGEYKKLAQRVIGLNYEDRDVAMRQIERLSRAPHFPGSLSEIETTLRKIRSLYANDAEMLYNLAMANRALGRDDVADALVTEAQEQGYETEETLVNKAIPAYTSGDTDYARQLIQRALGLPRGRFFTRERVIKAVVTHDPEYLPLLVETLSKSGLAPEERVYLSKQFMSSLDGMRAAEALLRPLVYDKPENDSSREIWMNDLSLVLISLGKFKEAMALISADRVSVMSLGVAETFNYAMAEWGATGVIPTDLFARVLQFQNASPGANFAQCQALSFWANGDLSNAHEQVAVALKELDDSEPLFSCWRYLQVEPSTFRQDLSTLITLIDTNIGVPEVIARAK